jgi:YfiH family protein
MKFENNSKAVLNKDTKVPFLTFPSLSGLSFIRHGFSTRLGGVSKGYFESMNLGNNRGDDQEAVDENFSRISESMGFDKNSLVLSDQVHNTKIRLVTEEDKGKGILKERDYQGVDGLITNIVKIPLVTFYADCVPLYFVDKKNHAIGLSHSGWRGTVNRMGKVTLEAMKKHFGTNPSDVITVIGPSICQDCYEVSADVVEAFCCEFTDQQLQNIVFDNRNGKYQLNLWEANNYILMDAGIPQENITVSGVCTCCNSDLLFSHRATQGRRGTLAAFLMLEH